VVKKAAVGLVLVAAIAAAVFLLWNRPQSATDQVDESVRRATVKRGELLVSVVATGSIVPREEVSLSFDLPGKVVQVWVETGDEVTAGDELARLDNTGLVFQVRQAEAALAAAQAQLDRLKAGPREEEEAAEEASLKAAQANVESAEANLSDLVVGPDEHQIAAAEANLDAAGASLWLSTVQRDQIVEGASAAEIAAAEAARASALTQQKVALDTHEMTMKCVTLKVPTPDGSKQEKTICPALGTPEEQARFNLAAAEGALDAAQAQLDRLLAGPTQSQIDTGEANLSIVTAQRDAAQAQLAQLQAGSSAGQLMAARANLAAKTAQRDAAQARLDLLRAGADVHQIAAAQANVDQAQVAVKMAQAELETAMLITPFDGVVTAVNVQEGQVVSPAVPAVTLADVSELQIVVGVDEIDVAEISEGQDVVISLDALPGQVISARVEKIAPVASQTGSVLVYQVIIVLDETGLPLRIGMSAAADITIDELEDVLLVPNWAIRFDRDTGATLANLVRTSTVEEVEIEIGVRGADSSQVLSGLEEGDVVVAGNVTGLRQLLEQGE
jgi:HlyD family secretion protein